MAPSATTAAPNPAPRSTPFSSSRSTSLASSSSTNSLSEIFRSEEPNSFNRSILQRDITPNCRIGASSSKVGHFAENLRVSRPEDVTKVWQSDAQVPHSITIELDRQSLLSELRFYVDYRSDESYTPRTVVVQLGSAIDTLTDFTTVNCEGSQGWVCVDLGGSVLRENLEVNDFVRCSIVRLFITSNCQMGRDSRIRGIRLFSPILPSSHYRDHDQYIHDRFIIK